MTDLNAKPIQQEIAEFLPPRPERFHDLNGAKDFIRELRQKRASYRAIADLLSRHQFPISKTSVGDFCHAILGEPRRPAKPRPRKRPTINPMPAPPAVAPPTISPTGNFTPRVRGPRIAQVRMLHPQPTPKTP